MENDNNNTRLAEEGGRHRWLKTAVAISLLLHFCVAIVIAIVQARRRDPPVVVDAEPKAVIAVSLRRRSVSPETTSADSGAAPNPDLANTAPPQQLPAPIPEPSDQNPASPSPTPGVETPITAPVAGPASTSGTPEALETQQLSASIARYMKSYQAEQRTSWLEECQRFRNRYFTQDCTLDPAIRSGNREIPVSTLVPLLSEDSPLGELARERYALTAGPRNFDIIGTREEQVLGPTVELIGFNSGSGLSGSLINNWLTRGVLGALGVVVTDPIPAPSLLKPEAPLPANIAEEPDPRGITAFEKTPSLFPGSD